MSNISPVERVQLRSYAKSAIVAVEQLQMVRQLKSYEAQAEHIAYWSEFFERQMDKIQRIDASILLEAQVPANWRAFLRGAGQ